MSDQGQMKFQVDGKKLVLTRNNGGVDVEIRTVEGKCHSVWLDGDCLVALRHFVGVTLMLQPSWKPRPATEQYRPLYRPVASAPVPGQAYDPLTPAILGAAAAMALTDSGSCRAPEPSPTSEPAPAPSFDSGGGGGDFGGGGATGDY
jgi:hypothetical protein